MKKVTFNNEFSYNQQSQLFSVDVQNRVVPENHHINKIWGHSSFTKCCVYKLESGTPIYYDSRSICPVHFTRVSNDLIKMYRFIAPKIEYFCE